MHNITRLIILLVILVLLGGVAFLVMWDMPAPTTRVEKTIPNASFTH